MVYYCLAKNVKFWTLITIDSENCDPKRLTPRQQLAYIAKRAQSGGSLLSDFQTDQMVMDSCGGRLDCKLEPFIGYSEADIEDGGTIDSTQALIQEDVGIIAAEEHNIASEPDDNLLELAENIPHSTFFTCEEPNQRLSTATNNEYSYLEEDIAAFFLAAHQLQTQRAAVLLSEQQIRAGKH